jgi:hypothetical protein
MTFYAIVTAILFVGLPEEVQTLGKTINNESANQ